MERERLYFEIDEKSAKQAKEMMSFSDYAAGSKTEEYKAYVDKAYALADKVAEERPEEADRAYQIAGRYSKKMADNMNAGSRIGCMCPSVMICGAGNFPVKKKERQNKASDKNYQEFNDIQKMLEKIKAILNGKDIIKSSDKDAAGKLEKKLTDLKERQEMMKAANDFYRKNGTIDGCPAMEQQEIDKIKRLMSSSFRYEDKPYQSYELKNNNQNIHSVEKRLKGLIAAKTDGNVEVENDMFKVVENTEIMRLQLLFDGKPEDDVRTVLKKHGFRWSPRNSCWQRQLTENAKYSLKQIVKELEVQE